MLAMELEHADKTQQIKPPHASLRNLSVHVIASIPISMQVEYRMSRDCSSDGALARRSPG